MKNRRFAGLMTALLCVSQVVTACGDGDKPKGPVIPTKPNKDTTTAANYEVGKMVPAWKEGEMDIHFINTTSGECMFVIFPDGTQMLIDAASSAVVTSSNGNNTNSGIRSRWDPTKTGQRGSQIIGAYLKKCMEWTGNNKIDYAVVTHFHNDHIGGVGSDTPQSANSSYYKTGMAEILDDFSVVKLLDRGYPLYNYPFDMATKADNASNCANYIKAVKWHVANRGLKAEIFKPGVADQIVMKDKSIAGVKVQNIAVNGEIWTGIGTTTNKTFPELSQIVVADTKNIASADNCPPENINSAVMKISYGKFDFFAGGDLQYTGQSSFSWKDAELPCAQVCGQVEVMKADHHGVNNTNKPEALKYLNPQVNVTCSWMDAHPRSVVLNSMMSTLPGCDFYITNFWKGPRAAGVDTQVSAADAAKVKGADGHVLVRVSDKGDSYRVVMLTDSDGKMAVKSVSEPYKCR